jgi:CRP/FNR family transcriptional regulator
LELFWSLPSVSVIQPAAEDSLVKLFDDAVLRRYDSGAKISDPESKPGRVFLCRTGTLKVTKLLSNGREILITILQSGSLWSDRAVLNGYWREIFIEAMEPLEIAMIDNAVFEKHLRSNPEALQTFMIRISEQVSDALTLLDDFRGRDVASRLARVLVKFSHQYGVQTNTGVRIDVPVTHQDLANMIGTARETVSRNMAQFRRDGYVRETHAGESLEILNLGSLEALIV